MGAGDVKIEKKYGNISCYFYSSPAIFYSDYILLTGCQVLLWNKPIKSL